MIHHAMNLCNQSLDCEVPRSTRDDGVIMHDALPSFHLGIILRA
jgi:hypothetical protein